jgi:hypothetical protein
MEIQVSMFMNKKHSRVLLLMASLLLFFGGAAMLFTDAQPVTAEPAAQLPTVAMATVTSSPYGPFFTCLEQVLGFCRVRTGPSSAFYSVTGILSYQQQAPAKGRNGDWVYIMVDFGDGHGWVYGPLGSVTGGALPIIEPPPTETPRVTATIDATLAAQFITTPEFTRLPTFTSAPTIAIPKFSDEAGGGSLPIGWVILFVGLLGIILGVLSLIQGR